MSAPTIEDIRASLQWVGGSCEPSDPTNSAVIVRGDARSHSGPGWYAYGEYPDEGAEWLGTDEELVRAAAESEGVEVPS